MADNIPEASGHSFASALAEQRERLAHLPHASPALESELLLSAVLQQPRSHLFAWPERALHSDHYQSFRALVERRLQGTPIAYLLGQREFWSLPLQVTPATLIPRPESELLVELALAQIPSDQPWQIADLGTGSGAIAAAIAYERPAATLYASDRSAAALQVARANFLRLQLHNVCCYQSDWLGAVAPSFRFHLIVANPPYIADHDPHLQQGDLPHEPRSALAAGPDGLRDLRQLCAQAPHHLHPGGWLLLEHGYQQAEAVRQLLRDNGLHQVSSYRDLAGQLRVTGSRF